MLRSTRDLTTYGITATDGDLGRVHDFYFDDFEWRIRYLVVDTGKWLPGRRVLISPAAIVRADWDVHIVHVDLPKDKVKNSPDVNTDKPVSRQSEEELALHYSWPYYWGARVGGGADAAGELMEKKAEEARPSEGDSKLRSVNEVAGYHIEATDGSVGHVEDFITEDDDWSIRYMVVDTRNWLPGRKVLVAPWLIQAVRWDESKVHVDMGRDLIKDAPAYNPD